MARIVFALTTLLTITSVGFAQDGKADGRQRLKDLRERFCTEEGGRGGVRPSMPEGSGGAEPALETCTPLMCAAESGRTDIVKVQLSGGADVNAKLDSGVTALMLAARAGQIETVKLLIAAGADVNAGAVGPHVGFITTLMDGLSSGNRDVVVALIDAGAEINPRHFRLLSPLTFVLMESGDTTMIKTLLDKGADVNLKDSKGSTALMVAASESSPQILKMLIAAGADVNARTDDGTTAFSIAKEMQRDEIVRLLKQAGARP